MILSFVALLVLMLILYWFGNKAGREDLGPVLDFAGFEPGHAGAEMGELESLDVLPSQALPEILRKEFSQTRNSGNPLSLVRIEVSETEGPVPLTKTPAELVARETARLLRNLARYSDEIVLCGPKRFLCLLPGTDLAGAEEFADRLLNAQGQSRSFHVPTFTCAFAVFDPTGFPGSVFAEVESTSSRKDLAA